MSEGSRWSLASWDYHPIKRYRCTSCNGYIFFPESAPLNYCPYCGKKKADVKDGSWLRVGTAEPDGAMLTK